MKISSLLVLSSLLLLSSCRSRGDEPQPTPQPEPPRPTLTLSLVPGATTLSLAATPLEGAGQSFLDLNANGLQDAGEELTKASHSYSLPSGTTRLQIYGDLATLDLTGSAVLQLQGAGLSRLTELQIAKTALSSTSLTELIGALPSGTEGVGRTLQIEEERLSSPHIRGLEAKGWRILRPSGTTIDPKLPTLIIRLQPLEEAQQGPSLSYEFDRAEGLWLDKNYNGVKDQGEDLPDGMGSLEHPQGGKPAVYIFHGVAASLDVMAMSSGGGDEGDPEEEPEGVSRLQQPPTKSRVAMEASLDLSRFPSLGVVSWEGHCGLTRIEATGAEHLVNLAVGDNPIRELALPIPSVLRTLVLTQSELTSLDLSTQTKLQTLSASKGRLQKVVLPRALDLTTLSLAEHRLTELDLTELPNLKNVRLEHNQLTKLTLGAAKYESLVLLDASSNQLTKLDLRPLIKTKRITISHNPLTEVLWPRDLKELRVASTELTLLDLTPEKGQTSFLQLLDASDNPKLRGVRVAESRLLKTLYLQGTPTLDLAQLPTSLPQHPAGGEGTLSIESQRLSPEQQRLIQARGWRVAP